jgi:hypothetical protein
MSVDIRPKPLPTLERLARSYARLKNANAEDRVRAKPTMPMIRSMMSAALAADAAAVHFQYAAVCI